MPFLRPEDRRLFCDTSFFYASLDPADIHSSIAREIAEELATQEMILVSTWDVVSETATLLLARRKADVAIKFLTSIRPKLQLIRYGEDLLVEAEKVFAKYAKSFRISFCDAISLILVQKVLRNIPILTFDRGFRALGCHVIPNTY